MLNKLQKESECALLLIQGESFRAIAKKLNMSFSDIARIRRKTSGEEPNDDQTKNLTKKTQALVLFSQGISPLESCIELDIDPEETEKAYSSFLRLNNLSKISKIIEKHGDFLEILEFYEFCKKKSIDKKKIEYILDKSKDISRLTTNYDKLVHQEEDLKNRSEKEFKNLDNLEYQIQNTTTNLENTRSNLLKIDNQINQKNKELSTLIQSINSLKNDSNFKIYEQRLYQIFKKIISEDALKTPLIIIAFLEVLRDNPIHKKIFSNYYQIFKNGNIKEDLKSKQDYVFFNFMTFIYDLSKKIYTIYRNKTIDDFHHHNSLAKSPYQNFF